MPILMASPVWASAPVSSHDPAMHGSAFCALAGAIDSERTSAVPANSAGQRDVPRKKFQIIPASCLEFVEHGRFGSHPRVLVVVGSRWKPIPYPKVVLVKKIHRLSRMMGCAFDHRDVATATVGSCLAACVAKKSRSELWMRCTRKPWAMITMRDARGPSSQAGKC